MSNLATILKKKQQVLLKYSQESRSEVIDWNNKVIQLYKQIKTWLKPLETQKLLSFEESSEAKYEMPLMGTKPILKIKLFNGQVIKFEPILNIVGAYGRIDMKFGLDKVMIVLKEKKSNWLFAEGYNRE
ncbi:hypothetical protein [Candidatus Marithrix sp. Canyon 246]|uniref:hypothetical protein n=1 Tax=Candidatus Marithrix sp. Canyon 246 TaxID=1827136 RepID=UPI00084A0701|nr:hypothetical protein [Candidatus Marithrix sp. Canyon 246]